MRTDTRSFYTVAVQSAIERLAINLGGATDLHRLASGAGLSPFHFHRVFRGMTGETPLELIRRLRMECAAWRLREGDASVTQIAFEAGFETHEAFTRAFRACYGVSPSGFRRASHGQIELSATCGVHFNPRGCVPQFIPRDTGGKTMDVEIKQLPALRLGAVRHVGSYHQISDAFARLGDLAGAAGLLGQPGTNLIAIYHDDVESTPPDQLRSDAAIVVAEDVPLPDGLTEQRLPAGSYASTVHVGPYTQIGDAWMRLMGEWLPASGRRAGDGPCYEVYLNTPETTPADQLETVLYMPVV